MRRPTSSGSTSASSASICSAATSRAQNFQPD